MGNVELAELEEVARGGVGGEGERGTGVMG